MTQTCLPEAFQLDPKVFDFVLNVVSIEGKLGWHLHRAGSTYRQDVLLTRSSHEPVSTAVQKLAEAQTVLGLQLDRQIKAIDLGKPCCTLTSSDQATLGCFAPKCVTPHSKSDICAADAADRSSLVKQWAALIWQHRSLGATTSNLVSNAFAWTLSNVLHIDGSGYGLHTL